MQSDMMGHTLGIGCDNQPSWVQGGVKEGFLKEVTSDSVCMCIQDCYYLVNFLKGQVLLS